MSADPMRDLRRVVRSVAIAVALLAAAGGPTGVHHSPDIPASIRPHPPGLLRLVDGPGPHPF